MKTVGEILKQERKRQKKSLSQIQQRTKIPLKTLRALEEDDFDQLPPATFAKGFIKNYAQVLGLKADRLLAIFRRDWQENKKGRVVPRGLESSLKEKAFFLTPRTTFVFLVSSLVFLFLGYLGLQLRSYLLPPKLVIEKPEEDQRINKEEVEVVGQASPDASVYVNSQLVEIDQQGNFSYQLRVFPGENSLEIKVVNRRGKETVVLRKIIVDKQS